jgi:hypothetical protein
VIEPFLIGVSRIVDFGQDDGVWRHG